jgi:serine/threonine protein kinase/tetratricopeptide (TPR) repeat protein
VAGGAGKGASGAPGPKPGALTALLAELSRAPEHARRTSWESALHPGATIGRFELIRELGRGGFGDVWEARDRELGRLVAFKAVRPGSEVSATETRIVREAETAARLAHPNLVTLFDVGRAEAGPYLVLELLRGETLGARISRGPFPAREALRVAREVAKGVAHAHGQGVVHRDLKPENVFLCEDGQIKVLDFGLAHAFGQRRLDGGTPAYMSPEQASGAPEDERADVFALGVMLYEMLSARLPFEPRRPGAPRPRRAAAIEVPELPELGSLIERMLAAEPLKRPRDAREVLVALEQVDPPTSADASVSREARPRRGPRSTPTRGRRSAGPGSRSRARAASIAVLPFADMSPARDQEYLSDGIAEEILNALAHIEGLRVTGRTSSFSFKGRNEDVREIGQKLGVTALLEGSVRKVGNRARIAAHLVGVADGYRIWSGTFDRDLTDILAVQDEIARAVVEALEVEMGPRPARNAEHRIRNRDAYMRYLLGQQRVNQGTADGIRAAVEAYEQALELDPRFAPAWAGLAVALIWRGDYADSATHVAEDRRRASLAAENAVALGGDTAAGHAARGYVRTFCSWDWAGARSDLDLALSLAPSKARCLYAYAELQAATGQLPAAIAAAHGAVDLDPLAAQYWASLGRLHDATGEHDLARTSLERALQLSPSHAFAACDLAITELLAGHPAAALAASERCAGKPYGLLALATAHAGLGHREASRRALDALIAGFAHHSAFQIAQAFAWLGERDAAFEWLDRAYAQRDPGLRRVGYDPLVRRIANDPRHGALMRRMKLAAG